MTAAVTLASMGNGPAFSAYASATLSVANATFVKVLFDTEEFDTANCFAASKFTPTVAGYYQINGGIMYQSGTSTGVYLISLSKNGSEYKRGNQNIAATNDTEATVGVVMYFNGTTDYVEIYTLQTSGTTKTLSSGSVFTYFNGAMVRGA